MRYDAFWRVGWDFSIPPQKQVAVFRDSFTASYGRGSDVVACGDGFLRERDWHGHGVRALPYGRGSDVVACGDGFLRERDR